MTGHEIDIVRFMAWKVYGCLNSAELSDDAKADLLRTYRDREEYQREFEGR